ncbi:unnamed protein product, partial [Staurois parvus]
VPYIGDQWEECSLHWWYQWEESSLHWWSVRRMFLTLVVSLNNLPLNWWSLGRMLLLHWWSVGRILPYIGGQCKECTLHW